MQDVLGRSGEHRMNFPGHPEGNWEWRFSWEQVKQEYTAELSGMSAEYERLPDCIRN
jgi:4-alpha-glucanotransferase